MGVWCVCSGLTLRLFAFLQVILSCVINSDLQYFKVMPTFHHWRAGKQRNGLTFQTAADARAFDKGVIRAYDDLIDGK
jgi:sprouty-related, EVH1 domain-containing protein